MVCGRMANISQKLIKIIGNLLYQENDYDLSSSAGHCCVTP